VNQSITESRQKSFKFGFVLMTSLFFSFGLITCLNDILVPHLKGLFQLSYTQAALVQFCFFSAYFFASLPSGKIVARVGYKRGTILGIGIAAAGCLLFYPAAGFQSYPIFLLGLFTLASGITLIQVTVNPYITVLGPPELASSRLTLAQAFNSLGTTVAPLMGSVLILGGSVQGPYLGLAGALIALAVIVSKVKLPEIDESVDLPTTSAGKASAWQHGRHFLLRRSRGRNRLLSDQFSGPAGDRRPE
jgi:FHS family L-fucose permease-like MFS transporter